jgi:hypothetical protein
MITPSPGARVYLACGYTDMRKGRFQARQPAGFERDAVPISAWRAKKRDMGSSRCPPRGS